MGRAVGIVATVVVESITLPGGDIPTGSDGADALSYDQWAVDATSQSAMPCGSRFVRQSIQKLPTQLGEPSSVQTSMVAGLRLQLDPSTPDLLFGQSNE